MDPFSDVPAMVQRILLACGLLAALLYLGTDWLAGRLLKGYSFAAQSMSELSAAGSPTRALVLPLTLAAGAFMTAFGVGIWQAAGPALLARLVGGLVIGNAVSGIIASLFFPNRFGERPRFVSAGVLLMFISVMCFLLAMVVGAAAFRGWFRILSITIPALYVLLAVVRFASARASPTGTTVPRIGTQERTMAYSYLLWAMALAIYLIQIYNKSTGSV